MAYLDAVQDADRHTAAIGRHTDAAARAERLMADEFLAAVRAGNVSAPALFAVRVPDRTTPKMVNGQHLKRNQTIAEVMESSLDYGSGPQMAEVMALLCKVSSGEIQTAAARELLGRMAEAFAGQNALVSE